VGNEFDRARDARAVTAAVATIGDGWKLLIVSRLLEAPLTLCELSSAMPDARATALAQQVKELIADDILCAEGKGTPWEVYSVTDYGRTLIPALDCMGLWGRMHLIRFD
jgi:DNA-binding HxlR family transcriptional regulator